jgi:hypothetical protein
MTALTGDGWITCPEVLDVVFLMKAIQPGDQLQFRYDNHPMAGDDAIAHEYRGAIITITRLLDVEPWFEAICKPHTPPVPLRTRLFRRRFVAWRRPLKEAA